MPVIFSKILLNLSQASMLRNVSLACLLSVFLAACQIPEEAPEVLEDKPAQPVAKEEKNKANLRGYIDREGKWAIQAQFITGGSFSEGLAHVVDPRGSYIDKKGNFVIKENYYLGGDFHEGLAWAAIPKTKWSAVNLPGDQLLYGYIDKNGKFVIKPQFRSANDFSDGMAMVMPLGEQKWGFINKSDWRQRTGRFRKNS